MPGYRLADAVHLARYDRATIVLDLAADRYVLAAGALHTVLHDALLPGPISDGEERAMATLLSKKLICPADCAPHASYLPPTLADRTSLLPVPPAAMGWRGFLIILRMIKTMIEVRHRPILDLVRGLQARKAQIPLAQTVPQDGLSYASSVAAALRGADLLLGANHHCLPRSICAMRLMLEHGLTPSMVMGVTEKPFEAHCWIELGPFVVADAPDRIMPYTPIFVL